MTRDNRPIRLTASKKQMDAFCSDLADGLHAVAQPLTIVQNELSPERIERLSEADLRQSISRSAVEMERVGSLFSILRQLIAIERFTPELEHLSSSDLIAESVDGVFRLFEERDIRLEIKPEGSYSVMAHRKRALQSLSVSLLAACALSKPGHMVEIGARRSSQAVSIDIQNPLLSLNHLDAHNKLIIAMVESSIRSQRGKLVHELRPFAVRFRFKKAPSMGGKGK